MTIPQGCKLHWSATSEQIKERCDSLAQKARALYDEIANGPTDLQSVVGGLSKWEASYAVERNMLDFFQHVSSEKDLRDASTEADKVLSALEVELQMRKDVFDKFVALKPTILNRSDVSEETKRYVHRKITLGERNGLHLSDEIREKIKALNTRESELGIQFTKNLGEENTILHFSDDDLIGCPQPFLTSLDKTDEGFFKMTLKYPHVFPTLKKAHNPTTRKKLQDAFNSRCKEENAPILESLIELRHERAKLLGYPTHADYVLEMRMAKNSKIVADFLENLAQKLEPVRQQEIEVFLKYKEETCQQHGFEYEPKLSPHDLLYLMTRVEEKDYAIDHEKLKEYFPMETVTKGMLEIYQQLLGLKFQEIPEPDTWHPDVKMFSVYDAEDPSFLYGYFYLDLHPRPGKYGHAAVFGLQPGCSLDPLGSNEQNQEHRQVAVAAMVANFTQATPERPSLLLHDELETFFHEFGHVMHQLCAHKVRHSIFSGTHVERDFVECPSQMLENWCWQRESLQLMSGHFEEPTRGIPEDLLNSLIASRKANMGHFTLRQITLAMFDQHCHTREKAVTKDLFAEVSQRYVKVEPSEESHFPASFGHLAGGYDAQYYGYLWSEVYSADMFASRFLNEGILNPRTGKDYREMILGPGGSKDALDMLREFLGREPTQDAFLQLKGLA